MVSIVERLSDIHRRIERACARCGRPTSEITLVGASKRQPIQLLQEAQAAGLQTFGENRVQEAGPKVAALPELTDWHLIGPLQSNKVRTAVKLFSTIHSLDRPKILAAVNREAERQGVKIRGFLEVNLGGENSKHGFPPSLNAPPVALDELQHLEIVGLMAIPPPSESAEDSRSWFRELRELRDHLQQSPEWSGFRGLLSMGMSQDFEVAVEEGATHIRCGTILFGPRPSTAQPTSPAW